MKLPYHFVCLPTLVAELTKNFIINVRLQETEELLELYRTLKSEGEGGDAAASALAALMAGISNSGYQLVVSAGVPQPVKDQVLQW